MIENTIFVIIDKKYISTCTQINQQNIHNYEYTKQFQTVQKQYGVCCTEITENGSIKN